jgi:MFS transporter, ACS family, hexuronate transporter
MKATIQRVEAVAEPQSHAGQFRWWVCALLFFAATVNYIDRQVIGILKPTLQGLYGWSEIDYSNIIFAFTTAYAIGLLFVGRLIDRLGVRKGFSLVVVFWSFAAMGHALARSVFGFATARFALALGESGSFPSSIKAVAEWFSKKDRAFATGIFNAGTNVGAIVAPLVVPWITLTYGWQWAFVATGALGFIWVIAWLATYTSPPESHRNSAGSTSTLGWASLLAHKQTWAFAIGKFLTDPIWWVYLFWLPDFLHSRHGLSLTEIGPPVVTIYVLADIGSIFGGWLSSSLIKKGRTVNASRKTAMLVCALAVVPIVFAARTASLWTAVALIGLAAAAHQGWSANLFTLASDMFPARAVGSVVGIGGMAGAVGGMLIAKIVGYVLEWTGSYFPVFVIAGSAYLVALLLVHLIVPRMEPASC